MSDPKIVRQNALANVDVAISVSESADLGRLGLTEFHCRIAVAELARAVILAGGRITYGGRIGSDNYTEVIIDEAQRYAAGRCVITVILARSEYSKLTCEELHEVDRRLGVSGRLLLVDELGHQHSISQLQDVDLVPPTDVARSLSAMREFVTANSDARVIVGGKLADYQGSLPGIIEEAISCLAADRPLYVAGGYGGAAAAVAGQLGYDDQEWAPANFPQGSASLEIKKALSGLSAAMTSQPANDGLTESERSQLASSHRAGDVATLVVSGLARARSSVG